MRHVVITGGTRGIGFGLARSFLQLGCRVTICGRRLSIIQGGMRTSTTDESTYFPVTVNATGLTMPNEGCYSITPVAYLRIKGITTMPRAQLTTAVVTARY